MMKIRFVLVSLLSLVFILSSFIPAKLDKNESLSELMDRITKDTKELRRSIESGKGLKKAKKYGISYTNIHTAIASDAGKKGEHFDGYATSFLKESERLRLADEINLKTQFNAVISSCINCHSTYCPGPLTMLKRMKLPE
jgi:cytochrome c556